MRTAPAVVAERKRWNRVEVLAALGAIPAMLIVGTAMAFMLSDARARFCPPGTFMYGSTNVGMVIAAVPWLFVGMFGYFTVMQFLTNFFRRNSRDSGGRRGSGQRRRTARIMRIIFASLLGFAILVSPFGLVTGFCALNNGIIFQSTPWARAVVYPWGDVTRVTVVCYVTYGRYGGNHNSYTLSMKDGAEINLFETPLSFKSGFESLRNVLRNVPMRHDTSQVLSNCNSMLRNLSPI